MSDAKQLFIPGKIAVGFQDRSDTYTGKLAYVIYYDNKGVKRKEKSWETWRDKKIDPIDFDNAPTDGFVLNKGVGGARQSYGWNTRNEYIRVYDPRNFEFEISVANLLFILRECDCSRGKGLEGKFVYAWDGTELVLLPEASSDYQNSKRYTQLQSQGVKVKDMIHGASYITKKQEILTYVGKFDYYDSKRKRSDGGYSLNYYSCKKYVFWGKDGFTYLDSLKSIAALNSDTIVDDFAELVDMYAKSKYASKIIKFFTIAEDNKVNGGGYSSGDHWAVENPDGSFSEYITSYKYWKPSEIESIHASKMVKVENGEAKTADLHGVAYPGETTPKSDRAYYWTGNYRQNTIPWIEPTNLRLYAELESGKKFRFIGGQLIGGGSK